MLTGRWSKSCSFNQNPKSAGSFRGPILTVQGIRAIYFFTCLSMFVFSFILLCICGGGRRRDPRVNMLKGQCVMFGCDICLLLALDSSLERVGSGPGSFALVSKAQRVEPVRAVSGTHATGMATPSFI